MANYLKQPTSAEWSTDKHSRSLIDSSVPESAPPTESESPNYLVRRILASAALAGVIGIGGGVIYVGDKALDRIHDMGEVGTTQEYLENSGAIDAVRRAVADIAEQHGIDPESIPEETIVRAGQHVQREMNRISGEASRQPDDIISVTLEKSFRSYRVLAEPVVTKLGE